MNAGLWLKTPNYLTEQITKTNYELFKETAQATEVFVCSFFARRAIVHVKVFNGLDIIDFMQKLSTLKVELDAAIRHPNEPSDRSTNDGALHSFRSQIESMQELLSLHLTVENRMQV